MNRYFEHRLQQHKYFHKQQQVFLQLDTARSLYLDTHLLIYTETFTGNNEGHQESLLITHFFGIINHQNPLLQL